MDTMMGDDQKEDLVARIAGLSERDRKDLIAQFSRPVVRKALARTEMDHLDSRYTEFWGTLLSVCPQRPSLFNFLSRYGRDEFVAKVDEVYEMLDSYKSLRKTQFDGMLTLMLRCLAKYRLVARDIPVTPSTMLNNLDFLVWATDRGYPGYYQSGLLYRLVRVAA